jgi:adenylylsulfate reductase, subunit A
VSLKRKDPEVEEREVDILIVGGGMAACGTAFEVKKWLPDQKVLLCDKAAMERSGAVAQGLSAINTYIGENSPDDYVRMVRNDLMGLVREDLIFDLGCHVDDSVHLFEEWGLPIWKKSEDGKNLDGKKGLKMGSLKGGAKPVRTGKWQIMINGESYKRIVAEAAKKAIGEDNILERVLHRRAAAGRQQVEIRSPALSVFLGSREQSLHHQSKDHDDRLRRRGKHLSAAFGRRGQRPRLVSGMECRFHLYMGMKVGAELSMMENRFTPARFKDGYGPVGAWFLLFKAKTLNGLGENFAASEAAKKELQNMLLTERPPSPRPVCVTT